MTSDKLRQLQADPAAFRNALLIDSGPLVELLDDWQDDDFRALDPGWRAAVGQSVPDAKSRAWLERPRGHSKSTDIAIMLTWALFASRNRLSGIVAACDQDQAALIRDAVDGLLRLNPWLASFVQVTRTHIANPHTGSTCQVITSDAASSYGHNPNFVICDELTHWPKDDLWLSLFSSAAKRAACMLVVICNAGFADSWQWDLREAVRSDDGWYFNSLDGPRASWISQSQLDEQSRLLPRIAFERLWLNRWGEGAGDAFERDDIDRLTTLPGPLLGPQSGWAYAAGVDIGVHCDSSSAVIVGVHVGSVKRKPGRIEDILDPTIRALIDLGHLPAPPRARDSISIVEPTGKLQVARVKFWTPTPGRPVNVQDVEDYIIAMHSQFRLSNVACDPWQSEQMGQRLRARGMRVVQVPPSARRLDEMARTMLDAVSEQRISFFPDETLRADLLSLRVEERQSGVKLTAPRQRGKELKGTRHADTASALQLALHGARRIRSTDSVSERPLVLYP